jgi:fatty acid amide hydrolase
MFKLDIAIPDLPFNDLMYQQIAAGKGLKVGIIRTNGLVDPVKGCSDRLEMAAERLRSLGYEVVDFQLPSVDELFRQMAASMHACMGQAIKESIQGETPIAAYNAFANFIRMRKLGPIMRFLLRRFGEMRLHENLKVPLMSNSTQAITLYYLLRDWKIAFTKAWQAAELDLVLCPSWPLPAPRHSEITQTMLALTYTSLWSLLGFPVGVLPTGPLNTPDLSYPDTVKDSITKGAQRHCEMAQGLPLALAVVGMPYMDEKVLGFLQVLERSGIARFLPALN